MRIKRKLKQTERKRVLIIKLGYSETLDPDNSGIVSLGDILRTTVILHLYPPAQFEVTWLVDPKGAPLLKGNQFIHRILIVNHFTPYLLLSETFDVVINFEKEPGVCAVADRIPSWRRFGFRLDPHTHTAVAYDYSDEALTIATDSNLKRRKLKSWSQILFEMLRERYKGQNYILGYKPRATVEHDVGLNHLIGKKFPLKRWPQKCWEELSTKLSTEFSVSWQQGADDLEDYIEWIAGCRVIVTNDSLGLHIALSLGKKVVGLFGPTMASEVEGAGMIRIVPPAEWDCVHCLESKCVKETSCMETIPVSEVHQAVRNLLCMESIS